MNDEAPFDDMAQRRPMPPMADPGPGSKSPRVLIGAGVAVGVVTLVAVLALALSGAGGKAKPAVAPTTRPRATSAPPTTLPATTSPPSPEASLIARVPTSYRATCKVLADQDKRNDFRNIPAITCDPSETVAVFFYQLPNPTVMNNEYHALVSANNLPDTTCDPSRNAGFRAASTYTTGSTERGKALCYVGTDHSARMEWTDDALDTYGSIAADDSAANRRAIYQFWVDNGALSR
jgi:hypothetical protein